MSDPLDWTRYSYDDHLDRIDEWYDEEYDDYYKPFSAPVRFPRLGGGIPNKEDD